MPKCYEIAPECVERDTHDEAVPKGDTPDEARTIRPPGPHAGTRHGNAPCGWNPSTVVLELARAANGRLRSGAGARVAAIPSAAARYIATDTLRAKGLSSLKRGRHHDR